MMLAWRAISILCCVLLWCLIGWVRDEIPPRGLVSSQADAPPVPVMPVPA